MNSSNKSRANASRSDRRHRAERRRRELAQREVGESTPAEPARRRPRWQIGAAIVAILAVVGGLVAAALAAGGDDGPDLGLRGEKLADDAPEQPIAAMPTTYRLTYGVEPQTGDALGEDITVDAPFATRYRVLGTDRQSVDFELVQTAQRQASFSNGVVDAMARATPQLLGLTTRFDATLGDLSADGFYTRRERRSVLERECTVYRTGATFEGGEVIAASETRYADLCISDDGFILEEVAVRDGEVELRVTIESIEILEPGDVDISVEDDEALLAESGVEVFDLDLDAEPTQPYFASDTGPEGFTHVSRQRVEVTRQDDSPGPVATRPAWSDVYRRGNDVIIVNQGPSGNELVQIETSFAPVATVGELEGASVVVGLGGVKIVAPAVDGRFVQVTGSVSKAELSAFAETLTAG